MCVNVCMLTHVHMCLSNCKLNFAHGVCVCARMHICMHLTFIADHLVQVVFTGMCNFGVTFPTSKTAVSSQDVANSLPPQTQLKSIVAAVWSTLVNTEQAFSVVVECQKFLLSVAQCDQGIHALCM